MDSVLKSQLHAHSIALVDAQIAEIRRQMHELIADSENDSKSTAGDKHETARAMMQLAQEQLGKQLHEAELKRTSLAHLNAETIHTAVAEGSLVKTAENLLYIAAPLGKITFENQEVFVISVHSPLGKLLLGKTTGQSVSLNQRTIQILSIV
jgi:transcription elongation GreA/GreB family factor